MRAFPVLTAAFFLAACQQSDQSLPFEVSGDATAQQTIGQTGGTVSLPPDFALDFPSGSLAGSTSVGVTPRVDEPFPSSQGTPVPGSAYDVTPAGTELASPARVDLAVDPLLLEAGEDIRLSVGVLQPDGSVQTFGGTYDVTNGVLSADIDRLGPVAAVISADAIPVGLEAPPSLNGGSIPSPVAPAPTAPSLTSHGGVTFSSSCSPDARRCFSSGLIRVWADATVRERLGDEMFLLDPSVQASLDFLSFDQDGIPTEVVGAISVQGDLRARLNSTVTRVEVDDGVSTGFGSEPTATQLQLVGGLMIFGETTDSEGFVEFNEEVEFDITGIGTSEMLVIEVDAEVEFDNEDGSVDTGIVTVHLRLRR